MHLREIAAAVEGEIVCAPGGTDQECSRAFSADMMSDVLALAEERVLFITGLAATQTIRTAMVAEISAVLIVRGKQIPPDVRSLAERNGIALIRSSYSMFRASGVLFAAGLKPLF